MPELLDSSGQKEGSGNEEVPIVPYGSFHRRPDEEWEVAEPSPEVPAGRPWIAWISGLALVGLVAAAIPLVVGVFRTKPPVPAPVVADDGAVLGRGDDAGARSVDGSDAGDKSDLANWEPMEFRAAAEPIVRSFLDASDVEALLPHVRNPGRVRDRCLAMFPGGTFPAVGLNAFDPKQSVRCEGRLAVVPVMTGEFRSQIVYMELGADGLKIDWEAWVGWSAIPWREFLEKRPQGSHVFRAALASTVYPVGAFRDDSKWKAYRLDSPDGSEFMYGYAAKESALEAELDGRLRAEGKSPPKLMLAVRFPAGPGERAQVLIDRIVSPIWHVESEESP